MSAYSQYESEDGVIKNLRRLREEEEDITYSITCNFDYTTLGNLQMLEVEHDPSCCWLHSTTPPDKPNKQLILVNSEVVNHAPQLANGRIHKDLLEQIVAKSASAVQCTSENCVPTVYYYNNDMNFYPGTFALNFAASYIYTFVDSQSAFPYVQLLSPVYESYTYGRETRKRFTTVAKLIVKLERVKLERDVETYKLSITEHLNK